MTRTDRLAYTDQAPLRELSGIKRVLPLGIYGRYYLIMMFPIIVILLVVSVVFIERHFAKVTSQMVQNFLPQINEIQLQILAADNLDALQNSYSVVMQVYNLDLELPVTDGIPETDRRVFFDLTGQSIIRTLRDNVSAIRVIDLSVQDEKNAIIYFDTRFGIAKLTVGRRLLSPSNPHQFLVLISFVAFLSVLISVLFLRNQLRPIRRLAAAAEAFGRGESVHLNLSGADEVRSATSAFLDMRDRIERHLLQMTEIMSCISHDLKTPLTRLRLGIEAIEDQAEKREIIKDIEVMNKMINEIQDFSKQGESEAYSDVDPTNLARSVADGNSRMGHAVTLVEDIKDDSPATIRCKPIALRRSLENLVVNATRHAEEIVITVRMNPGMLEYSVEDNGPGIDPAEYEQVKLPFMRLDRARNLDAGEGVGLGLTIANQVALQHGGYLALGRSRDMGGLRACIRIPV